MGGGWRSVEMGKPGLRDLQGRWLGGEHPGRFC